MDMSLGRLTWFLVIALQRLRGLGGHIADGLSKLAMFFALFLGCVLLFELLVPGLVAHLQVAGFKQLAEARLPLAVCPLL